MTFDGDANRAELRNGISQSQYCAQDPNGTKDSCQGDSGLLFFFQLDSVNDKP